MSEFFKKDFLTWLDEDGFRIKDTWDMAKGRWSGPGDLVLFPHQRRILEHVLTVQEDGTFPYVTVVYSCPKKCMEENERLWLTDGSWVRSGDLVGKQFKVWAFDGRTFVPADASAESNGIDGCYRIRTELGHEILRTAEHPLLTWDGWKRVADLEVGECIGVPQCVNEPENPEPDNPELMRFLGYMIAEGGMGGKSTPIFTQLPGPVLDDMQEIGTKLGYELKFKNSQQNRNDYAVLGGAVICRKYGLLGKLSHEHRVPAEVFRHSNADVAEFLSAYFDGDGWACTSDNGSTLRVEIGFGTISYGLAKDVVTLLSRFGLHPHIHSKPMPTGRHVKVSYHVLLGCSDEVLIASKFLKSRGKKDALRRVTELAESRDIHRAAKSENLPKDAWDDVFHAKEVSGKSWGVKSGPIKETWAATREKIVHFAERFRDDQLRKKALLPIVWDKVVSIEYVGELPTVAISVPGYENYISDVIDHNSGKTQINAAVVSWFAQNAPDGTEVFVTANDIDQAEGRVMKDVKYHYNHVDLDDNPRINQYEIKFHTGTFVQALAQSFKSNAGSRHAFVSFDELWGASSEASRRMWDEMTPIPTIPYSLRFISTYAGFLNESDLLWELYLQGVGKEEHPDGRGEVVPELADITDSYGNPVCFRNGKIFTYWDHEPRMPWQTTEYYDQQLKELRPSAYIRLHENRWVTTHEAYIPIEWWDRSIDETWKSSDIWFEHPYRQRQVFIGVDASSKRDCTAVVGVGYDPTKGEVGVLFHRIWTPKEGELFDHETTVEAYIREKKQQGYRIAKIVYDPAHFVQTANKLKMSGFPMEEYTQTVINMTLASQKLYDLLKSKSFRTYADDEIRQHIMNASAQEETRGFRIVKQKDTNHVHKPIDAAIALAMAAYKAVEAGGVDFSTPTVVTSPFSDVSTFRSVSGGQKFGWPFDD